MKINKHIDYYGTLGVPNNSTDRDIKSAYKKMSKTYHPEAGGDVEIFNAVLEAYTILSESRDKYDSISIYGQNYDSMSDMMDSSTLSDMYGDYDYTKIKKAKDDESLDIVVYVDESTFDGSLKYERLVTCKTCNGTGKDFDAKIEVKDKNGDVIATYDGYDGCDFCEGTGKDLNDKSIDCRFCFGAGKIGEIDCSTCSGEQRILGVQRIPNLKLSNKKTTVIKFSGNMSKRHPGRVGDLIIVKKETP